VGDSRKRLSNEEKAIGHDGRIFASSRRWKYQQSIKVAKRQIKSYFEMKKKSKDFIYFFK